MDRTRLTTEPDDGQFAVWFDNKGEPEAVYWRADRYSDTYDGPERWLRADQSGCDPYEPWTWANLCAEMSGRDGPYLLILAEGQS